MSRAAVGGNSQWRVGIPWTCNLGLYRGRERPVAVVWSVVEGFFVFLDLFLFLWPPFSYSVFLLSGQVEKVGRLKK